MASSFPRGAREVNGPRGLSEPSWLRGRFTPENISATMTGSAIAFGAEPGKPVEALLQFAFIAALDRLVENGALHRLGEVVLPREGVLGVVVVGIARAVALILHQPRRCVQDVLRRRFGPGLPRHVPGGLVGNIARVRLRRERKVGHRLRQRQFALGAAKALVDLP